MNEDWVELPQFNVRISTKALIEALEKDGPLPMFVCYPLTYPAKIELSIQTGNSPMKCQK